MDHELSMSPGTPRLPPEQSSRRPEAIGDVRLLEIDSLSKTLGRNAVLKGVSMTVRPREVHALMGGNGAGKSTLIKCLSGYWRPDGGTISVDGSPLDPAAKRIAFVQQDLGLIADLNVVENTCLGRGFETGRFGRIRWRRESARVHALLADLGHPDIDPLAKISTLDQVERTVVAIARATQSLREGARLLVLDEPTAALPVDEAQRLFETIHRLRASGVGMLYVSHHIAQVLDLADRISVLRDGELVETAPASSMTESHLIATMLGREVAPLQRGVSCDVSTSPTVLELDHVYGPRVNDITFDVRVGEIVGLAGLQGAGCTEVAELIFGAAALRSGNIAVRGEAVRFGHPADAVAAGIGLVTEDRHGDGSFLGLTVGENIVATDLRRFARFKALSARQERDEIAGLIDRFGISPADGNQRFGSLSGGNQQKAILAKWLRLQPHLLICDQPDVGVDIGAKQAIYATIRELAQGGSAVLVISNQYDDLAALCDRVVVLRDGRVAAVLAGAAVNEHEISTASFSQTPSPVKAER
jgi:ribose transport system ATP-binding protein